VSVVVEFSKKVDHVHSCIVCKRNCSKSTTKEVVTMQNVQGMSDKLTVGNCCTLGGSSQK
jgi:hypothetical protein